jgi:hypothetical protein
MAQTMRVASSGPLVVVVVVVVVTVPRSQRLGDLVWCWVVVVVPSESFVMVTQQLGGVLDDEMSTSNMVVRSLAVVTVHKLS